MPEPPPGPRGSRGFILAMLLVAITVIGILLTMALPVTRTELQREKEAELVFRGEALASAIRTYKAKTGGYPLSLTELTKLRPRIVRKLYLDPMTADGEWALITAVQPGASGDTSGLPIVGVRSKCQDNSFMIYKGKTLISDWAFSAADNLLGVPGGGTLPAAMQTALGQDGKTTEGGTATTTGATPAPAAPENPK